MSERNLKQQIHIRCFVKIGKTLALLKMISSKCYEIQVVLSDTSSLRKGEKMCMMTLEMGNIKHKK